MPKTFVHIDVEPEAKKEFDKLKNELKIKNNNLTNTKLLNELIENHRKVMGEISDKV